MSFFFFFKTTRSHNIVDIYGVLLRPSYGPGAVTTVLYALYLNLPKNPVVGRVNNSFMKGYNNA